LNQEPAVQPSTGPAGSNLADASVRTPQISFQDSALIRRQLPALRATHETSLRVEETERARGGGLAALELGYVECKADRIYYFFYNFRSLKPDQSQWRFIESGTTRVIG
jgi:hypothetical protein